MKEVNKRPVWLWLVLCLPMVFIVYFAISLSDGNIAPESVSTVDVTTPSGQALSFDGADDVEFYVNLYLEADPLSKPIRSVENEKPLSVVIKQKAADTAFELYAEANTNGCFFRNGEGAYFSVPQSYAKRLLQRQECAYVYGKAGYTLPTLLFKTGDEELEVLPIKYSWQYKDIVGTAVTDTLTEKATERQFFSFYSDVGFALSFAKQPTQHTISFYDENGLALNISDPSALIFATDTQIRAVIEAKWEESDNALGGSASYEFDLLYDVLPEIIHSVDRVTAGDSVCIGFRHFSKGESISLNTQLITSELNVTYGEDGTAFALIPVSRENAAGDYTLSFTVGSVEKAFTLSVVEPEKHFNTAFMDAEKYNEFLKPDYKEKLALLLAGINAENGEAMIASGSNFTKPVDGSVLHDYGTELIVNGLPDSYMVNGIDYRTEDGASVKAAQRGVVVYSAEDEVYGNMLIIDHGYGVKSHYYGLAALGKAEGDTVANGEIIGTAGTSGLVYTENSAKIPTLHFAVTINGVYVNPNTLFENGIVLVG